MGSSKTPIAYYLSYNLELPIFNNDAIRTEVREDLLRFDPDEYIARKEKRLKNLISQKRSFIHDASIDRQWPKFKQSLEENSYLWFIISINISEAFLKKTYEAKGYTVLDVLPKNIQEHTDFVKNYRDDIGLNIDDDTYPQRLDLSLKGVEKWMRENEIKR